MPRTFKSKSDREKQDRKNNLAAAIGKVRSNELTIAHASRQYGVPYSTLCNHKGIGKKIGAGRPTILTRTEEQEIVVTCQVSTINTATVDKILPLHNNRHK